MFGTIASAVQRRRRHRALPAPPGRARGQRACRSTGGALAPVPTRTSTEVAPFVPEPRRRYLAEVAEAVRGYHAHSAEQVAAVRAVDQLEAVRDRLAADDRATATSTRSSSRLAARSIRRAPALLDHYRTVDVPKHTGPDRPIHTSLSDTEVPRIALPRITEPGRAPPLPAGGEPAGALPLHRRRVPDAPRRRGPHPHVRRRGRAGQDERPLPLPGRRAAGHPPVGGLRLGDALRRRPGRGPGHLRQGRQLRCVGGHARRHGRPCSPASTCSTRRPRCR